MKFKKTEGHIAPRRHALHSATPWPAHPLALAIAVAGVVAAAPALAQEATTLDRITVTGTNIPRADIETASPVQVVTRQEIDRTGKTTIAEYLQTLTVDGQGSIPKSFGNGFSAGGAGISLRGLGAGSTLVLLNGRRLAPYGLADDGQKVYTDLSTIPLDAVERVEVLKDGASAIYGSDAIAGVVNIILRSDFTGTIAKASYGTSKYDDADARKGSITVGWGDLATDRYNFFFTVDAGKTDNATIWERDDRKWIGTGDIRRWGYPYDGIAGLAGFIGANGVATNSPVGAVRLADGSYQMLPGCEQFNSHVDASQPPPPNGGCLWEVGRFRDLSPSEKYLNFFSRGTFAVSDNAELYTELSYSTKQTTFNNTPSGVSGTWGYPGGVVVTGSGPDEMTISALHPDNPTGRTDRIRYSAWDVGPRVSNIDNEFMRALVGLKGTAGEWDYDMGLLHSQGRVTNKRTGFLVNSRVRTVLNDPASPVGWWRIGDDAGANSQALYDYIAPELVSIGKSTLDSFDITANRSLADLPGGPLGLALGAEYRRTRLSLRPTTFTDIGDIIGLGFSAYRGTEEVAIAKAEMVAPVTETLELTGALRLDSYRDGDNSVTPKFGVKWTPTEWIALRGTYGEGFRAPNPAETGGQLAAFSTTTDPVRCPGGAPYPGADPVPNCNSATVGIVTTGTSDLDPEKSKSYTVGVVLDPTPTTSITIDAWQIERKNEINTEPVSAAIAAGRAIRSDDNLVVGGVPLPGTGTLLAVTTQYFNSTSTKVRGIDLDARQKFDLGGAGMLSLDLQWSHISSFERVDGDTTIQWAGTHGNCDVTNCLGTPKDRINFGATWDYNDLFSISSVVNYRGKMDNVLEEGDSCAAHFDDGTDAPRGCEIREFYTIDLSATWNPTEHWQVFGSVQNVTDRIAPLDPTTYGAINYNPLDFSGAIGRYYTLGLRYAFN